MTPKCDRIKGAGGHNRFGGIGLEASGADQLAAVNAALILSRDSALALMN